MDEKEKAQRCFYAVLDAKDAGIDRCFVYGRWLTHDLEVGDRCPDCAFATISRIKDKPIW